MNKSLAVGYRSDFNLGLLHPCDSNSRLPGSRDDPSVFVESPTIQLNLIHVGKPLIGPFSTSVSKYLGDVQNQNYTKKE